MPQSLFQTSAQKILAGAGIQIDGQRPWDIQVHDDRLYQRIFTQGSLGLGESYMDGWWDCKALDQLFTKLLRVDIDDRAKYRWSLLPIYLRAKMLNLQKKSRAFQIGGHHYDIGNALYSRMLDRRMAYSCGYWKHAKTLDQAQEAKLDLICKKLGLKSGMRILDIGCGWGSLVKFATEKYKVKAVGITVSKEQLAYGKKSCSGLPVELRLQDYRDLDGQFDRIVSVGMFEHVGYKNYRTYMEVAHRCLKDDGLFLLHTIGSNRSVTVTDPWIEKYIFPNSMLPSIKQIAGSIEGLFIMEDWHNFSVDYDKTLMVWFANVEKHWNELKKTYDERFHRMWRYYLLSCAGSFRSRWNQLWQIVLSKKGVVGGYNPIR